MSTEIIKIDEPLEGLEKSKAQAITAVFTPMTERLRELEGYVSEIVTESKKEVTKELTVKAKRLRLDIGKIRTTSDKLRKKQKENILREGKAIQGVYNIIEWAVKDEEEKLRKIEKHFEIIEAERLKKLQNERSSELSKYMDDISHLNLAAMDDDVWTAYLKQKKEDFEILEAAKKKARKDREEKQRIDNLQKARRFHLMEKGLIQFAEDEYSDKLGTLGTDQWECLAHNLSTKKQEHESEQERVKKENEKLKKQAEIEAASKLKEQQEREAKEEKDRLFREAEKKKEREKMDAEFAKQKAIADKIKADAKKKEDELNAKIKSQEDSRVKEIAEKEAKEQAVLNQNDTEKFESMISDLRVIKLYSFESKANQKKHIDTCTLIDKIINHIK